MATHALVLCSGRLADAALLLADGPGATTADGEAALRPWTVTEDRRELEHGDECGLDARTAREIEDRIAFLSAWEDVPPAWLGV